MRVVGRGWAQLDPGTGSGRGEGREEGDWLYCGGWGVVGSVA